MTRSANNPPRAPHARRVESFRAGRRRHVLGRACRSGVAETVKIFVLLQRERRFHVPDVPKPHGEFQARTPPRIPWERPGDAWGALLGRTSVLFPVLFCSTAICNVIFRCFWLVLSKFWDKKDARATRRGFPGRFSTDLGSIFQRIFENFKRQGPTRCAEG